MKCDKKKHLISQWNIREMHRNTDIVSEHSQLKSTDFCFMFAAGVSLSNGNGTGAHCGLFVQGAQNIQPVTLSSEQVEVEWLTLFLHFNVEVAVEVNIEVEVDTFQCYMSSAFAAGAGVPLAMALSLWPICAGPGISERTTSHFKFPQVEVEGLTLHHWHLSMLHFFSIQCESSLHQLAENTLSHHQLLYAQMFRSIKSGSISREHAVPSSAALCSLFRSIKSGPGASYL